MLTHNLAAGRPFDISRYTLRKTQDGPKHSPDIVTIGRPPGSYGFAEAPLVSRTNDGEWEPVTQFQDVVTLIHDSYQPDSQTEIGVWKDSKKWGLFKDGEIQNKEVTDLWDRNGWDLPRTRRYEGRFVDVLAQPEQAELSAHRHRGAVLEVPMRLMD